MDQIKILELVHEICEKESTNCHSLNKLALARELMNIGEIPSNAEVQENPLDWDNQVVILFILPNDKNYYSLFAGIGNDGEFHFDLSITGILKGNKFEFFDEDQRLNMDYFKN